MLQQQILNTGNSPEEPARSLVSRSAILIVSGVLIGTGMGGGAMTGLQACSLSAGLIGVIAYFGLSWVARRSRSRLASRTIEATRATLDSRMDRHRKQIEALVESHRRPAQSEDSSYLPVAIRRSA